MWLGDAGPMLTEFYIEALLVDKELADHVWMMWVSAEIDDQLATVSWWVIASRNKQFKQLVIA